MQEAAKREEGKRTGRPGDGEYYAGLPPHHISQLAEQKRYHLPRAKTEFWGRKSLARLQAAAVRPQAGASRGKREVS